MESGHGCDVRRGDRLVGVRVDVLHRAPDPRRLLRAQAHRDVDGLPRKEIQQRACQDELRLQTDQGAVVSETTALVVCFTAAHAAT
nr:hypothetical protein GCM10025699_77070 [Microbacterium flavescens]